MKTVVVTGASRGIGLCLVRKLLSRGHKVLATVRSFPVSSELKELGKSNSRLYVFKMDLSIEHDVVRCAESILAEHQVDVIINNAGYILFGPIELANYSDIDTQFKVNVIGPAVFTNTLLSSMKKRSQGLVVFLGSTSGVDVHPMYAWYSATKHVIEVVAKSLRVNLKRWNIDVVLFTNSATKTGILSKGAKLGSRLDSTPEYKVYADNSYNFLREIIAKGLEPHEVANKIVQVVESTERDYRYFTNEDASNLAEKISIDEEKKGLDAMFNFEQNWFGGICGS